MSALRLDDTTSSISEECKSTVELVSEEFPQFAKSQELKPEIEAVLPETTESASENVVVKQHMDKAQICNPMEPNFAVKQLHDQPHLFHEIVSDFLFLHSSLIHQKYQ